MPNAKRVFITGASSGLGRAIAMRYAQQGAILGLVARNAEDLEELASSLGVQSVCYPLDVRDTTAMHNAAHDFMARFGVPDIVVASAGASCGSLTELAEDIPVFQDLFDVNVMGMIKTFQPFILPMRKAKNGSLAGIASVAGFRGLPGAGGYSASKAAVIAYLESLRVELRNSGISVTTICPGYIETPMTEVNPYLMPFIMKPDTAARIIMSAIDKRRSFLTLPWQMSVIGYILRLMPNALFDLLFARAPHKPRHIKI